HCWGPGQTCPGQGELLKGLVRTEKVIHRLLVAVGEKQFPFAHLNEPAQPFARFASCRPCLATIDEPEWVPGRGNLDFFWRGGNKLLGGRSQRIEDRM